MREIKVWPEEYRAIARIEELWLPNTITLQLWLALLAFSSATVSALWWFIVGVLRIFGIHIPMASSFSETSIEYIFGFLGLIFIVVLIIAFISLLVIVFKSFFKMRHPKSMAEIIRAEIENYFKKQQSQTDKMVFSIGNIKVTLERISDSK